MPEITLRLPNNSLFHSSLNEIDLAMGEVLLNQMRIADPRDSSRKQSNTISTFGKSPEQIEKQNWLWDRSRVFQVDELETEELFNTYLLRKKINKQNNVDVSYPLLGYVQNDIDTVFWGTGNRYRQWEFDIPVEPESWEVDDEVVIAAIGKYRGLRGNIVEIKTIDDSLYCAININNDTVDFSVEDLRPTGDKVPYKYKAKAVTGTYSAVVLCDNRDEIQYLRDKFILRCADGQIWHKYKSPSIQMSENQIFTVFGIPNIGRYSKSVDKLKGEGYVYGMAFNVNFWGSLTDAPLPQTLIEQIRMTLKVEGDSRNPRIVIN